MKKIILILLLLLMVSNANALWISTAPTRATVHSEYDTTFGTITKIPIYLKNINDIPILASIDVTDNTTMFVPDNTIDLSPNSSKTIYVYILVNQENRSEAVIIVYKSSVDEEKATTSTLIRVEGTPINKKIVYPKNMVLEYKRQKSKTIIWPLEVQNPYNTSLIIRGTSFTNQIATSDISLSPNEKGFLNLTVNLDKKINTEGNIVFDYIVGGNNVVKTINVNTRLNIYSNTIYIIAIILIILILVVINFVFRRKKSVL